MATASVSLSGDCPNRLLALQQHCNTNKLSLLCLWLRHLLCWVPGQVGLCVSPLGVDVLCFIALWLSRKEAWFLRPDTLEAPLNSGIGLSAEVPDVDPRTPLVLKLKPCIMRSFLTSLWHLGWGFL